MTGYDIQKYERCLEMTKQLHLQIKTKGDKIYVYNTPINTVLGSFTTVDNVFSFLTGYASGKSAALWNKNF